MGKRYVWLLAGIFLLSAGAPARAQQLQKWELSPFVGYETSGSYPLTPTSTTITVSSLRANSALSFGTFIDYSLSENFRAEFMWNRNNTSYSEQQFPNPAWVNAYNSDIDQYQFGGLYYFMGREHKIRPYAAGGVGFTHEFNSGGTPNRTDFAYNIGGGVRYQWTSHIAFRGDARYLPTYANTSLGTYCDPFFGCYQANVHNYQSRGNFTAGMIFSF